MFRLALTIFSISGFDAHAFQSMSHRAHHPRQFGWVPSLVKQPGISAYNIIDASNLVQMPKEGAPSLKFRMKGNHRLYPVQSLKSELNVWYQMLRDNSYAGIALFFLSFLAGSINIGMWSWGRALAAMTLGTLYIASFDTVNNLVGVEQDKLDKPHRPYAAGLVTRHGMIVRSILAQIAYVSMGFAFNVGWLSLLWVVVGAGGYLTGLDHSHWFKNHVFISVGVLAMMSSGASVAGYSLGMKWWKLVAPFAFSHGTLCSLQDLKDYEGDLTTGRRTLATTLGPDKFRKLCMWVHAIMTPMLWAWMYGPLFATKPLVASLFIAGTSFNIFRVVQRLATLKDYSMQHKKTYNLYVKATSVAYLSFAWLM